MMINEYLFTNPNSECYDFWKLDGEKDLLQQYKFMIYNFTNTLPIII